LEWDKLLWCTRLVCAPGAVRAAWGWGPPPPTHTPPPRQVLDASSHRYIAVDAENKVPFTITNVGGFEGKSIPLLPKDADGSKFGHKVMQVGPRVFVEPEDAATMKPGEEVTLMRWGNCGIDRVDRDAAGRVVAVTGHFVPDGDFKKWPKISWVADVESNVPCKLVEFDFLITAKKLDEATDFKGVLNPVTRAETSALGEAAMRLLPEGAIIQLERRGFFRVDRAYLGPELPMMLFNVPDGKSNAVSILSTKLAHR
jgi:glutamyl-tRNA synthetase